MKMFAKLSHWSGIGTDFEHVTVCPVLDSFKSNVPVLL